MTRKPNFPLTPPFEDLESAFHKKKGKLIGESSKKQEDKQFESFEKTSNKKEAGESEPEDEPKNNMVDIAYMTIEVYKRRMHDDNGPGLVQPTCPRHLASS